MSKYTIDLSLYDADQISEFLVEGGYDLNDSGDLEVSDQNEYDLIMQIIESYLLKKEEVKKEEVKKEEVEEVEEEEVEEEVEYYTTIPLKYVLNPDLLDRLEKEKKIVKDDKGYHFISKPESGTTEGKILKNWESVKDNTTGFKNGDENVFYGGKFLDKHPEIIKKYSDKLKKLSLLYLLEDMDVYEQINKEIGVSSPKKVKIATNWKEFLEGKDISDIQKITSNEGYTFYTAKKDTDKYYVIVADNKSLLNKIDKGDRILSESNLLVVYYPTSSAGGSSKIARWFKNTFGKNASEFSKSPSKVASKSPSKVASKSPSKSAKKEKDVEIGKMSSVQDQMLQLEATLNKSDSSSGTIFNRDWSIVKGDNKVGGILVQTKNRTARIEK